MAEYEQITVEQRGRAALVTLCRPDRLNAWTPRMALELTDAIERANADREVGAIVLSGAGRAFCAGADVRDAFERREAQPTPRSGNAAAPRTQGSWVHLVRESKPLLA